MPETIGQQLKAARLEKNLSLEKVTQATHIKPRLIEAMEADDFESLPSPVQARAFLRLYVEFLGLSLDEMIARQRLDAGIPTPEILSSLPVPTQVSAQEELPTQPDSTRAAGQLPAGKSFPFLEKIKGLALRLRKPAKHPAPPSALADHGSIDLPHSDPDPVNTLPSDLITPPVVKPAPVLPPDPIAEPVEDPIEIPAQAWQEESLPPAGLQTENEESQRIFAGIGLALRQRRESLSLTLDEIESNTHVRQHYLLAMERGDFDHLPSSVQTRGMLNNYSHFLDMDVDAILLLFAEGLQARRLERQPALAEKAPTANKGIPRLNLPAGLRRYLSMDILVGGGLILVLLAFAIWGTSRVISLHSVVTPQSTAQSISDFLTGASGTVTFTPSPSIAGTEATLPTAGVTAIGTIPAAGPGPVQVVVVALEESYLRVTVDGKSQFDGRISVGTAYSFSGNNQIEVLTGNGAGISILFNQGNLGPMGRFGEVIDRIYTATAILNPTATNTPTPTISPTPTLTPRYSPTPTLTKTLLAPPATP
jgi:cytoskeletal protein RodZ